MFDRINHTVRHFFMKKFLLNIYFIFVKKTFKETDSSVRLGHSCLLLSFNITCQHFDLFNSSRQIDKIAYCRHIRLICLSNAMFNYVFQLNISTKSLNMFAWEHRT